MRAANWLADGFTYGLPDGALRPLFITHEREAISAGDPAAGRVWPPFEDPASSMRHVPSHEQTADPSQVRDPAGGWAVRVAGSDDMSEFL